MGAVFRAEQVQPIRCEVALKIIKLGMDTDQVVATRSPTAGLLKLTLLR